MSTSRLPAHSIQFGLSAEVALQLVELNGWASSSSIAQVDAHSCCAGGSQSMNSSRRLIAPPRATTESSPLIRACAAVAAALADVNAAVSSGYGWWSTRTRPSGQAHREGSKCAERSKWQQ